MYRDIDSEAGAGEGSGGDLLMASGGSFSDGAVRRGFIRKVYGLLSAQLLLTTGIIGVFFAEPVRLYVYQNQWVFWTAFAGSLILLLTLACCGQMRRRSPHNVIFLGLFTVAEGILLGAATASFTAIEVLFAVAICCAVVGALTLFAFQSRVDFTTKGGFLLAGLVCFMIFGIFCIIFPSKIINIVYATIGALIFSFYIVFDTQMMIGGKHKYAIDPEEYVFGALNLYLDIINLFIMILNLIGAARG